MPPPPTPPCVAQGLLGISIALLGQFGLRAQEAHFASPPGGLAPSPPGAPLASDDGYAPVPIGVLRGPIILIVVAMLITIVHLFFLNRWRTCSVTFVTRARVWLLCIALYAQARARAVNLLNR